MAEKKKSGRGQGAKTTAKRKPLVKTKKTPEKKLKKKASSGDYVVDYHTAQAEKKEKAARGSKPSSGAAFLARNARKTADKAIEQRREKDEKSAKKSEAKPKPKAKAKPAAKKAKEKTVQRIKAGSGKIDRSPAPKKAETKKAETKKAKAPAKKKEPSSFGKAFSKAHDSGADTFMWKGKKYTTKRADGSETKGRKATKSKTKASNKAKEVTPSKKAPGTKRERTSPRKPQK
tara:strand:- start:6 stop:701 length:696 start_codon:yes stop_codon:yes gene_type:complete